MTVALDHLGTLRGALSDWLYDPRYTVEPYGAQAAHANAVEAALEACRTYGLGDVALDLSRGHGWEDTAARWAWRLPERDCDGMAREDVSVEINKVGIYLFGERINLGPHCCTIVGRMMLDFWTHRKCERWSISCLGEDSIFYLRRPEGLALLDTLRPKGATP